ncbi:hypothetical protein BC830DRAFT_1099536 [Chytriomyces sp. MP71]|nr:hypothetical protein BC830DRAFT_1099536 [Chytriomyces sp. MP71]
MLRRVTFLFNNHVRSHHILHNDLIQNEEIHVDGMSARRRTYRCIHDIDQIPKRRRRRSFPCNNRRFLTNGGGNGRYYRRARPRCAGGSRRGDPPNPASHRASRHSRSRAGRLSRCRWLVCSVGYQKAPSTWDRRCCAVEREVVWCPAGQGLRLCWGIHYRPCNWCARRWSGRRAHRWFPKVWSAQTFRGGWQTRGSGCGNRGRRVLTFATGSSREFNMSAAHSR